MRYCFQLMQNADGQGCSGRREKALFHGQKSTFQSEALSLPLRAFRPSIFLKKTLYSAFKKSDNNTNPTDRNARRVVKKSLTASLRSGTVATHTDNKQVNMRIKTLVLTAAATAAGLASSMAQNVYSLNVVGYVNVSVPANSFKLIVNPLNSPTNTLGALIPTAPNGTLFYKYTPGSGYAGYQFDDIENAWLPTGNISLAPGDGGFFRNVTGSAMTLTFVGEVMQGSFTNTVPAGFSIQASLFPKAENLTQMAFPPENGDIVYKYTPGTGYAGYQYDDIELAWLPSDPSFTVGEAFFVRKVSQSQWRRSFVVN
jgi:hypothetical protein